MNTNLLAEFNYNKSKGILASGDYYGAFKSKIEGYLKTKASTDPSPLTTDDGQSVILLYGWQKQAPEQDENGSTITITEELWYGLYPQATFLSRL